MFLRFYLFSNVVGCNEALNKAYCDAAFEGINAAEMELFGQTFTMGENWDEFYTTVPEGDELEVLQIKQMPAFIVYDVDRQKAMFKLDKEDIIKENVMAACMTAWGLQPNPANEEEYITPTGETVSIGEMLNAKPCPSWLPNFMCNGKSPFGLGKFFSVLSWVVIIVLVVILYKMIK